MVSIVFFFFILIAVNADAKFYRPKRKNHSYNAATQLVLQDFVSHSSRKNFMKYSSDLSKDFIWIAFRDSFGDLSKIALEIPLPILPEVLPAIFQMTLRGFSSEFSPENY